MGQVGNSQAHNMVMSSMSGESCRHIERLKVVGCCNMWPNSHQFKAIGCGSSHRCHRKCIPIHMKATTSIPPRAHKAKS